MFKEKTKEERIREKEEEAKITNLEIYKRDVFKNNIAWGIKTALTITAIPLSLTVAKEVFGIDLNINNTTWYADFCNTMFNALSSWHTTIVCGAVTTIGGIIGAFPDTARSVDEKDKQKYFMEHKNEIKEGLEDITILDVEDFTKKQLEDYANRGRSKVLR